MDDFSELSQRLTKQLTLKERKDHGVYFTPRAFRTQLIDIMKQHCPRPSRILEPSFGSGEFLEDAAAIFPDAYLRGTELHGEMVDQVVKERRAVERGWELTQGDFLRTLPQPGESAQYDWVIGNPPYCVALKKDLPPDLIQWVKGRANLYALFIVQSILHWINPNGGVLGFVVPKNFLTTAFYDPIRRWILTKAEVVAIEDLRGADYIDTAQDTVAFVVRMPGTTATAAAAANKFVWNCQDRVLFKTADAPPPESGGRTLRELGFEVKTGPVVWNQHKDQLRDTGGAANYPLIYASCITAAGGVTVAKGGEMQRGKKPYIAKLAKEPTIGPVILVNRGYGNASYKLVSALVEDRVEGSAFYVENHVNMVIPKTDEARAIIGKVQKVLASDATSKVLAQLSSNGALSKSELETVLRLQI